MAYSRIKAKDLKPDSLVFIETIVRVVEVEVEGDFVYLTFRVDDIEDGCFTYGAHCDEDIELYEGHGE